MAVAGSVSADGALFATLQTTPGRIRAGLEAAPGGSLVIEVGGASFAVQECTVRRIERRWPFAELTLADSRLGGRHLEMLAFAPLRAGDAGEDSALPVLLVRIRVRTGAIGGAAQACTLRWQGATAGWTAAWRAGDLRSDGPACPVAAGGRHELWLCLAHRDPEGLAARRFADASAVAAHALAGAEGLLAATRHLEQRLPVSGRPVIDEALRWNAGAAVMLTRLHRDGAVLTMGYKELNQRDSFWTSFLHLLLWPELDRRMIEESIAAQRADGKIPTCILPTIERDVDIDINAYFVLRAVRHLAEHPDPALAAAWLPPVLRACAFLEGLDDDGLGLPRQRTFWVDWKDVQGVAARTYAPHACLITAAAWRQAGRLAATTGAVGEADRLEALARRAEAACDRPFDEGGLWNGRCYQQRWADGRDDGVLLLDQTIAGLFGVIAPQRLALVWRELDARAATPFGPSETVPWYPASFGYEPGHYHNGGVWPWLSYADAWCRLARGDAEGGAAQLAAVAWADLHRHGDCLPHEYLAADDGASCGFPIQGWDACFVAAVHYGWRGLAAPTVSLPGAQP
jgi:hypothetical protein